MELDSFLHVNLYNNLRKKEITHRHGDVKIKRRSSFLTKIFMFGSCLVLFYNCLEILQIKV